MDDTLREKVKLLKVYKNVSYKAIAQKLGVKTKSLYNWLHGEYTFSVDTANRLKRIVEEMAGQ